MTNFSDQLTPFFHLVYKDWNASVHRQGEQLSALIKTEWSSSKKSLDVFLRHRNSSHRTCNARVLRYRFDLSEKAIERAKQEAHCRNVEVSFSVCDMRKAHVHHGSGFDVVVSGDNSLPHLSSVPTLFEEEQLLSGGVVDVVGHDLCK